jgi:hypothetical protein
MDRPKNKVQQGFYFTGNRPKPDDFLGRRSSGFVSDE